MVFDPLGYYKILGADYNTDDKTLKLNYREKAKFWHPDHNPAENALEEFQKISLAYDILHNPQRKFIYDLLSLIYDRHSFPDMKSLKIYKAVNGSEIPFLRVFKLYRVADVFKKPHITEEKLIGTYDDALKFINDITKKNWRNGWWTPKAFILNIEALQNNYKNIGTNKDDNLKLLIHNAAAYYSENKNDKAFLSAVQALEYAESAQKANIQKFLNNIPAVTVQIPTWNYRVLKKIQLKIPVIILTAIAAAGLLASLPFLKLLWHTDQRDTIAYYQEVRFNTGGETVDDVIVSKVFNIPVDISDAKMLYHLTAKIKVMHGPAEQFDVLTETIKNQTVRITGYTPDQEWYRIMLDNGEMGFVKKAYVKQGIGLPIPKDSKIFESADTTTADAR